MVYVQKGLILNAIDNLSDICHYKYMIPRILAEKLKYLSGKFPVLSIIGPRQSGKTTLVKYIFPEHKYISMEDLDNREFADQDPRGFLSQHKTGLILDEIQRVPKLFSYIQTISDEYNDAGRFILTGSQNFLLHEKISQTLAGRTAILRLLPFSLSELHSASIIFDDLEEYLFHGFYPRIYDKQIEPTDWYPSYIQTYIERDVHLIKNITDINTFQRFIKLCAGRNGQILNLSSMGDDLGVSSNTMKSWLSILEASFIIFLLKPYYNNFNKRIIKMPKLYFYDTGLVCSLLGIESKKQVETHYIKGSLFESLILSEFVKYRFNQGRDNNCYYWRDKTGHEIDCIINDSGHTKAVEIKFGKTVISDFFKNLNYWNKITLQPFGRNYIVYGGYENQTRSNGKIISWKNLQDVFTDQMP